MILVRSAGRVLIVAGLVGIGWAVGHAQTPAQPNAAAAQPAPPELAGNSDFELQVFTANGETQVRCVRGCKLTWAPTVAPKNGPVEMLVPTVKVDGVVVEEGCIATGWNGSKNCHILGWTKWPK